MSELLKKIDVVIFDLGEVLIDLDYPKVIKGFSDAANRNQKEIEELVVTAPTLQEFEVGNVSEMEFRRNVNDIIGAKLDTDAFDGIWNSMLKSISKKRLELVEKIGERYQVYILSNTNSIHEVRFNQMIKKETGKSSFYDYADNVYYSHDIGNRKPNIDCFQFVIDDIMINPSRVLFLDDRLDNVMAALSVGINALQITKPDLQIRQIFELD